jgi:hypothetical protein
MKYSCVCVLMRNQRPNAIFPGLQGHLPLAMDLSMSVET